MARKGNRVVGIGDDWEVRADLEAFQRYCEIKKDPKRLAKVKALAKERLEEMAMITAEAQEK